MFRLNRRAVGAALSVPLAVAALVLGGCAPVRGHAVRPPRRAASVHGVVMQGAPAAIGTAPLVDHQGPVLPAPHLYAIWWGNPVDFPADAQAGMTAFFNGVSGSGYLQIIAQYMRGAGVSASPVTNLVDTTSPPVRTAGPALVTEIAKLTRRTVDPNGIYFVFTSNTPTGVPYCGLHSSARVGRAEIAYAYLPNPTGRPGCMPRVQLGANTLSESTQAWVNVTAHELLEAMTDPRPLTTAAWIDDLGAEIGDKCAWQFAAPVQLADDSRWQLQEEWSNQTGGCVQG